MHTGNMRTTQTIVWQRRLGMPCVAACASHLSAQSASPFDTAPPVPTHPPAASPATVSAGAAPKPAFAADTGASCRSARFLTDARIPGTGEESDAMRAASPPPPSNALLPPPPRARSLPTPTGSTEKSGGMAENCNQPRRSPGSAPSEPVGCELCGSPLQGTQARLSGASGARANNSQRARAASCAHRCR
jgi:hypothetical protein